MSRFPKILTLFLWLLVTLGSFAVGVAATAAVSYLTYSALGSYGPYGPAFTLVACLVIASFPVSLIVGFVAARRAHRHFSRRNA